METDFEDPRFVTYLVLSNIALVVLALLGPMWCIVGIAGFAALEVVSAFARRARPEPATI